MELLSPRAKRALDRLTEITSGNRSLVFDALSRLERGDDKEIRDVADVIEFLKAGGRPEITRRIGVTQTIANSF
jgi:hypothetical protein